MTKFPSITSYVALRNNQIISDGLVLCEKSGVSTPDFLLHAYEELQLNYPKFYKMDHLCRTGFLAAEVLLREKAWSEKYRPEEIGIIFSCANSSLDTDLRFEETVANIPSPALFVYTLPNILIGEIAIRNLVKGESACFVFDIFDASFQTAYINTLFDSGKVKACISGWADFYEDKAEAFFYLAEINESNSNPKHDSNNISKIYTELWKN